MSFFSLCASFGLCASSQNEREITDGVAAPTNYADTMRYLSQVPLVKRLPKDQYQVIASACVFQDFQPGDAIIRQGDIGQDFFVIRAGTAKVTVREESGAERQVLTLKEYDYFGENAMLRDEPRLATVTALTQLSLITISRKDFQALGLSEKLQFANRRAVGGGNAQQFKKETRAPTPKTPEERALICEALRKNENLQVMVSKALGDDKALNELADLCWKEDVEEGEEVITEGDISANYFYIVQSGRFGIYLEDKKSAKSMRKSTQVNDVGPEGSFGELALLYLVPRAATVKALTKSVVWVIDRANFKEILMKVSTECLTDYVKYLDRVEILTTLLPEEKMELAKAMTEMYFTKGEEVIRQGEPGDSFYILYDGEVTIIKDGAEVAVLQASTQAQTAHYFGERALLNKENRAATVKVTSDEAKILSLKSDVFKLLLGSLEDIMTKSAEQRQEAIKDKEEAEAKKGMEKVNTAQQREETSANQAAKVQATLQDSTPARAKERVQQSDLSKIGLLGCGGFGIVELAEHKITGNTYALKGLSKGYVVKLGMQECVKNEKNILLMTNSPFIIVLYETFNSPQMLYFLMEPALGGEVYTTYNRKGLYGKEGHAKYYSAGVIEAFDHLHERHIIYRDLKPENLLMNSKGQLKLTDMGLAKFVIGKTYTTCGTPDYFAPELITSSGHTSAVDWWCLGVLIFELMTGKAPFDSPSPMMIYNKVMKGIDKITFPIICHGPLKSLIKDLLKQNPSQRLPVRPGGVQNLKKAEWYRGFDWDSFTNLTMQVPFKPVVRSRKDLTNFSVRQEDLPQVIKYVDDGSGWEESFASST